MRANKCLSQALYPGVDNHVMPGRHSVPDAIDPYHDRRRSLMLIAIILGVLLSGAIVLTASRAAFSAQTSNSANSFEAGTVTLTDDDTGLAMFTVTNMAPDDPAIVRCIEVSYQGTIPDAGEVRLYSGGLTDSGSLAAELDITVDIGTGSTTLNDCTNFSFASTIFTTNTLAAFHAAHSNYTSGVVAWNPVGTPETRTFRLTVDLPSDADNAVQGDSVTSLVFTWEVQS